MYQLSNENLEVTLSSRGAELLSMKDSDGEEFIWNGDKKHWAYHAPHLFPVIGRLEDDILKVEGHDYTMVRHGFARISDFALVEKDENSITFRLSSNDETAKRYPFLFNFLVSYALEGRTLKVGYTVVNKDEKTIYFSVGGHPAFLAPRREDEEFEDYLLEFEEPEDLMRWKLKPSGLFSREKSLFGKGVKVIPLKKETFLDDALVFDHLKKNRITLKSKKNPKELVFDFPEFPFLGIWTMTDSAPFICLEPWFGHADFEDFNGEFSEKEGNVSLEVGKTFHAGYSITIR